MIDTGIQSLSAENVKPIKSLYIVRILAFLMVFFDHTKIAVGLGELGVEVFLVLSGFLLVYNYYYQEIESDIKSCIGFSVLKIKKLYPLHLIMLVFAIILDYLRHGASAFSNIKSVLVKIGINISLIHSWIPSKDIYFSYNGVVWYLSLILFLYALFPVMLPAVKRLKSKKQALTLIIALVAVQFFVFVLVNVFKNDISGQIIDWFTYVCPLYRALDMLAGCLLGWMYVNDKLKKTNSFGIICILILTAIAAYVNYQLIYTENAKFVGCAPHYMATALLLIYGFVNIDNHALVNNGLIEYFAKMTPYYFLIHNVVIGYVRYVLKTLGNYQNNRILVAGISIVLTIAAADGYQRLKKAKSGIG